MSKVTTKSKTGDVYCAMKVKPYSVSFDVSFGSPHSIPLTSRCAQRYILFFVLERELILQQNDPTYDPFDMRAPDSVVTGYEGIEMPNELPKRYRALVLPPGWYLPSRIKRRSHKESHGLRSFAGKCRAPVKMHGNEPHPSLFVTPRFEQKSCTKLQDNRQRDIQLHRRSCEESPET